MKKGLILVLSLKYVLQNKDSLLSKMEIYLFHSFSMQYLEVHLNPRDLRVSMMSAWDPLVVYTKTKFQEPIYIYAKDPKVSKIVILVYYEKVNNIYNSVR